MRKDKILVEAACLDNVRALELAHDEIRWDQEFVLWAVGVGGVALQYADPKLRKDPKFVRACAKRNVWALDSASQEMRQDLALILAVAETSPMALQFAAPEIRSHPAIAAAAKKARQPIPRTPPTLLANLGTASRTASVAKPSKTYLNSTEKYGECTLARYHRHMQAKGVYDARPDEVPRSAPTPSRSSTAQSNRASSSQGHRESAAHGGTRGRSLQITTDKWMLEPGGTALSRHSSGTAGTTGSDLIRPTKAHPGRTAHLGSVVKPPAPGEFIDQFELPGSLPTTPRGDWSPAAPLPISDAPPPPPPRPEASFAWQNESPAASGQVPKKGFVASLKNMISFSRTRKPKS
mmetsp:Transcript_14173/g.42206  ORF Transcript_14173/g.42206 Transcript_14173/m.42206 type:complete len:350 (+) Transcript_14173:1-1050(+)